MAKIDDPVGKIEEHYYPDEDWAQKLANEITDKALLPLIPEVGWLLVRVRGFIKERSEGGIF
jgi:hypothetical protein